MATLTAGDAERVLRFVAEAAQIGGDEPFTDHVLVELRKPARPTGSPRI